MYLIDDEDLESLNTNENESNQISIINQLKRKNEDLNETMEFRKKELSADVTAVLKDYLRNIESVDIMSKIFDVNEETNILRAMLNLNLNN